MVYCILPMLYLFKHLQFSYIMFLRLKDSNYFHFIFELDMSNFLIDPLF